MGLHKVKQVAANHENCNTTSWKIKQELIWVHKWKAELFVSLYKKKKKWQILEVEPI